MQQKWKEFQVTGIIGVTRREGGGPGKTSRRRNFPAAIFENPFEFKQNSKLLPQTVPSLHKFTLSTSIKLIHFIQFFIQRLEKYLHLYLKKNQQKSIKKYLPTNKYIRHNIAQQLRHLIIDKLHLVLLGEELRKLGLAVFVNVAIFEALTLFHLQ